MNQILVGIDGSEESRKAAKKGAEFAAATKSLLRLVCVVPPFEAYANVPESPREKREERAAAQALVDEVARDLVGVQVETQVAEGIPAQVLADLASSPEVDTVVVGHRGRSQLSRLLIGSVSNRLVQLSPKPVLVVR